jgi:hypothetical protein
VLVHDQPTAASQQASDPVQRAGEVGDVVERPVRQDRVEGAGTDELLQRNWFEDVTKRCVRIDRDDLVTEACDGPRELALAAPDLEHVGGSRRNVRFDEGGDIHATPEYPLQESASIRA